MTEKEEKMRDKLLNLIRDNLDLPVVPFVNGGGEWGNTYWQGDIKDVEIGDVEGVVYVRNGEYIEYRTCSCMPARRAMWRIERSGLGESLQRCTFETFLAPEPWQKAMKTAADRFVEDHSGAWFFAGGQPGAGKTHICTAIVGELLKHGKEARYMLWKDEATYLKAHINEDAYETRILFITRSEETM